MGAQELTKEDRAIARAALQYVKSNVEATETLKKNWSLCRLEREEFLDSHRIFEYMNTFPVLRTQYGLELLLEDFNYMFGAKKDAFYAAREHLSRAVILTGVKKGDLSEDLIDNPNGKNKKQMSNIKL